MDIKNKFVHIFDCSHLIPASYPCCDSSPPLPVPRPQPDDPFRPHPAAFGQSMPPPFAADEASAGYQSGAYGCSLLPCLGEELDEAVCACNYNTGNVVTFKNSCDIKKHNCRFDTAFKVILNEVCPWEFESRRANNQLAVDYSDPKYYNN